MFCGSPRRYQPRWFRSPPMAGIKEQGADCHEYQNYVAQAPDGLFLICMAHDGNTTWVRATLASLVQTGDYVLDLVEEPMGNP